ncbi:MAG TPA: carboxy terminal-processing peptidase [Sediminibacterium sp.]|nr:carboxy terminal-processing peptidase [Sediminibacterium sp.]
MKSRKGLILTAIILFGGLFFAFRNTVLGKSDILMTRQQQLLAAVGSVLEQQHYSPKIINDEFSRKIFAKYLDELDGDKSLFLQSDVDSLKKYENTIDDEIHGQLAIRFVPAVSKLYDKQIDDVTRIYREILSHPFDFTKEESVVLDGDKLDYVNSEAALAERWRKKLKYMTLDRYADQIKEREANKGKKDYEVKADSTLEREAREKVLKLMNDNYEHIRKTFNDEQRFGSFLNVITNMMDPHSDYFPPVEKRSFDEQMSGKFYGIGATLAKDDYGIKISSIVTGGAAWKSGEIVVGDVITKVAQGADKPVDVAGFETQDAVKLIRGGKGTEVRLTIKKQDGSIKVVSMIREEVVQDELYARSAVFQNGNKKIGYIMLPSFYADFNDAEGHRCSEDVAKEVEKLKAAQVNGIVIDIRTNGGGSLYEVVKMVGLFIKTGPVVQVRERDGSVDQRTWQDNDPSVLYDGPLAVMVNEFSASASEIFAAAIQDYKRGVIIGSSSTYGKGTVQRQINFGRRDPVTNLPDMGAMTLTFQKFYRINGGSTQLKGVQPDVVVPDPYEYIKGREKDNPEALPWDNIPAETYATWTGTNNYATVIAKEKTKISQSPGLRILSENLKWLASNAEQPVPLKLDTYQALQKRVLSTVEQDNNILKVVNTLPVSVTKEDYDKYYNNPDKPKGERYQAWLKALNKDMYIDETVKMVGEMSGIPVETVRK